ncbi:anaphase-promoting complex subunit 1-like [Littorina saxatilis]|uniref:Anaphase-promoting complex subunit 1 n=1 Tax=Littorina saxatilis TaxID=31220 RepID=A0AAN9BJR2_9CAEN
MISACDTQDFVPFGREYVRHHPGEFQIQVQNVSHLDTSAVPLVKSFRDFSLQETTGSKKERWVFHGAGGVNVKEDRDRVENLRDEELYISGQTVVWSRTGQDGVRSVIKTFTMDTAVLQCLWTTFILSGSEASPETTVPDKSGGHDMAQSGVCVIESNVLTFFVEEGGEYSAVLPFQVSQTWPIKNGLLFERALTASELSSASKKNSPNYTIVFSMFHPLDDVCPVITKTSGGGGPPKVSYMTDSSQHILFTSENPSLAFTYDTMMGLHSAWRVRQARPEECSSLSVNLENTSLLHLTSMHGLNQSTSSQSRLAPLNLSAPSSSFSPMRNLSERLFSPTAFMRSSPALPHFTNSRTQSPTLASSEAALYRFATPPPQVRAANMYLRTPNSSFNTSMFGNESCMEAPAAPQPEVCFEHLWTEPAPTMRDGPLGKASKVFLTTDFCGQQYLCFMVPYKQQLRCVRFEESNDLSQLIFGTVTVLTAKDACPVESVDLMLILDTTGFVTVCTGVTKISHLHIPLLPLGSSSLSLLRATTPQTSPTRGQVFTSSRPPSAMDARFDEEMTHISPVPLQFEGTPSQLEGSMGDSLQESSFMQGIRDNVRNRFCVELLNGSLFRTSLPSICTSPGIDLCLKALKHLLPKDTALQLLGQWYTLRNTPGGIGIQSEWHVFQRCLLSLMGYDTSRLALTSKRELDRSMSPVMSAKRARPSDQGAEEDWDNLVSSSHHSHVLEELESCLGLDPCEVTPDRSSYSKPCSIDTTSLLFPQCPVVLMALHLVYEELKLNILQHGEVEALAPLLYQIARDLRCASYGDVYCRDFPQLFDMYDEVSQVSEGELSKMQYPQVFPSHAPVVLDWLCNSLRGQQQPPFIYIPAVCCNTQNVISLYALMLHKDVPSEQAIERCLRKLAPAGHRAPTAELSLSRSFHASPATANLAHRMLLTMTHLGMTQQDVDCLPVGVSLPFRETILHCRCNPPSDWSEQEYNLIGRQDLWQLQVGLVLPTRPVKSPTPMQPMSKSNPAKGDEDGIEHLDQELLSLRWSDDLRVQEVRKMLQSAHPVQIAVVQRPEVSDHDFIEEQERHLYSICIRTMALPLGRGMFTLCSYTPMTTEMLPIPKLCLTGRASPRNTMVELSRVEVPPNMTGWPHFHNGVAAGLRIANFSQVESAWIIYNRPKNNELTNEYAGFLMALGLNGHLPNLDTLNKHDYLSKGHEMTTIGILLGLSAAKRGMMDLATTKILSVHVPALLPPTSTELNIPHNVQVAAVLGVGLVYQGTAHTHMAEVLLAEIGRPPGPEMENCIDRESYSLAAGLALGLVMFGKGKQAIGLSNHSMADILCHLMVGGQRRPLPGIYRERYRSPSYLIKEGDCVNVDVTSPGATLALGMLFFHTGNSAVAEWLQAPDTQFMLDHVRPDFLLLRTLSRGLVLWDTVLPSKAWVENTIPHLVQKFAFKKGEEENEDVDDSIDFETMSQAWVNITAGSAMVLGLKFAGTANQKAFDILLEYMRRMLDIMLTPALCEQAGKSTMENCASVVLTALAMVMAGTGNLEVLRICRFLRKRVGQQYGGAMYGSHMAHSMATGLLFLGGGKHTLCTTPEAVGALLIAFFPKYPIFSTDNKYHLQAFRHLYVLAAKPRIIVPHDVDSGKACFVPLQVKFKDCKDYQSQTFTTYAPCLLPELHTLEEVKVLGPRYWPIVFHREKNWEKIQTILQSGGVLAVKQRAGHLSYCEDPKGYRSQLGKSLTADHSSHSFTKPDVIKSFTSDPSIVSLAEFFLGKADLDVSMVQELSMVVYQCVVQEKADSICPHFVLQQLLQQSEQCGYTQGLWQLKLCLAYNNSAFRLQALRGAMLLPPPSVLEQQFLLSVSKQIDDRLEQWQAGNSGVVACYLSGVPMKGQEVGCLSQYLTWFDIPSPASMAQLESQETELSLPVLFQHLPGVDVRSLMRIMSVWQASHAQS